MNIRSATLTLNHPKNLPAALLVVLCTQSLPLNASEVAIYKSIAADGTVIFTDKPSSDATLVTPSPLNVMDAQKPAAADDNANQDAAGTTASSPNAELALPSSVTIVSPKDQDTLMDNEGPIWVELQTTPAGLPQGLSAEVLLNGSVVAAGWSTSLPVDVPFRGTHSLQSRILDSAGTVIAVSKAIQVHVKQRVVSGKR